MTRAGLIVSLGCTLFAGCAGAPDAPEVPPNLLLVTIDTLRADAVGCYGSAAGATPRLDALAARGVRFETAWTTTPLTTPAHATLFTGTYPGTHGVRNNGRLRLPDEAETLAEVLAAEGYRTAAVISAFPLRRMFGLDQGFAVYEQELGYDARGREATQRNAAAVNRKALPLLRELAAGERPWFLWVHYYDPHEPYAPPEPFASEPTLTPYLGEVAEADRALGEVLDLLDASGAAARTVVVVAGDHGEGLGDHGESEHGVLLYEPMLRVPLVVSAPGRWPAGAASPVPASLADVAPTVLGLLSRPVIPGTQGEDLGPAVLEDAPDTLRPLYAETFYPREEFDWAPLRALRVGDDKLVLGAEPELYDLGTDPAEAQDRSAAEPDAAASLTRRLSELARAYERAEAPGSTVLLSQESVDALAGLGYVAGGVASGKDPWDRSGRSPREAITDYERFLDATDAVQEGDFSRALALLDPLVASDPGNPQFLLNRAVARIGTGDAGGGESDLTGLIRTHPRFYLAYRQLSSLFESQGRLEEAEALWGWLHAVGGPSFVGADLRLVRILIERGDRERARRMLEGHRRRLPDDPEGLTLLGHLAAAEGRAEEALGFYREALGPAERYPGALRGAADVLLGLGRTEEAAGYLDRAVASAPASAEVRSLRSVALARLGRIEAALEDARAAVALDPASRLHRRNLGSVLLGAERPRDALAVFDALLAEDPLDIETLLPRAFARLHLGDREGAARDLRALLARNPGSARARALLDRIEAGR